MIIMRIEPVSVAKVGGILYGGLGLIIGAVLCVGMVGGGFWGEGRFFFSGAAAGIAALILVPIFYAGLGFIVTLVGAALFNLATRLAGGVEIDVD